FRQHLRSRRAAMASRRPNPKSPLPGDVIEHAPLGRLAHEAGSVRQAVQRLRWFRRSFTEQVATLSARSGVALSVQDDKLAEVFVAWLRKFEAQKPADPEARRAYTRFSSGLMLREMLRVDPLTVESLPAVRDRRDPAHFWPEGHAYAVYCVNVRAAVMRQEFDETLILSPWWHDIEAWWSFKENVTEDPPLAIPFLDLFCGDAPNWAFPNVFTVEPPASPSLDGPSSLSLPSAAPQATEGR
ncbi:MAG: hypothetical protein AAF321_12320, partial [Pseudomonadota bacterium]